MADEPKTEKQAVAAANEPSPLERAAAAQGGLGHVSPAVALDEEGDVKTEEAAPPSEPPAAPSAPPVADEPEDAGSILQDAPPLEQQTEYEAATDQPHQPAEAMAPVTPVSAQDKWGPYADYQHITTPVGEFGCPAGHIMSLEKTKVWNVKKGVMEDSWKAVYEKVRIIDDRLAPRYRGPRNR